MNIAHCVQDKSNALHAIGINLIDMREIIHYVATPLSLLRGQV